MLTQPVPIEINGVEYKLVFDFRAKRFYEQHSGESLLYTYSQMRLGLQGLSYTRMCDLGWAALQSDLAKRPEQGRLTFEQWCEFVDQNLSSDKVMTAIAEAVNRSLPAPKKQQEAEATPVAVPPVPQSQTPDGTSFGDSPVSDSASLTTSSGS